MPARDRAPQELLKEIAELRSRLEEAEETLSAIRQGDIDALVVSGSAGDQVYTLRGAEHAYRVFVEAISEGAATLSSDGIVFYCNSRFAGMLKLPLERIIGSPVGSYVEQDDRILLESLLQEALHKNSKGEIRLRVGDGALLPVLVSISAMDLEGKSSLCVLLTDLTEQKRNGEIVASERLMRCVLDQAGEAIVVCDCTGHIIHANALAHQLAGCNPLIRSFDELYPLRQEMDGEFFTVASVIQKGEIFHGMRVSLKKENGQVFFLLLNARILCDHLNDTAGCVITLNDITRQQGLEAQLRQAQKMEAIGTLAGGIAHDFNNILGIILGCTEMALLDAPREDILYKNLESVFNAGCRAKELVKQILAFSRKTEQVKMPVCVSLIVRETFKLLRASLPSTIEIQLDVAKEAKLSTVLADPTQVHQILMNLSSNAAHAMRKKGGTLKVSLHNVDIGTEFVAEHPDITCEPYLKLSVSDTGHGMKEAVMQRIFDPYFTTKKQGEGTGLGLAVVYGIVKSCEGTISVQSKSGKGSTFHVYFPRIDNAIEPQSEIPEPIPTGRGRILVVDDEPVVLATNSRALKRLGYEVIVESSSTEALKTFCSDPTQFDLILTDQTMPHMTGMELTEEILRVRPNMPIILCTGFSELVDEKRAWAAGICGFLMKPVSMGDLARAIHDTLHIK